VGTIGHFGSLHTTSFTSFDKYRKFNVAIKGILGCNLELFFLWIGTSWFLSKPCLVNDLFLETRCQLQPNISFSFSGWEPQVGCKMEKEILGFN
jgi:hypothetical protein